MKNASVNAASAHVVNELRMLSSTNAARMGIKVRIRGELRVGAPHSDIGTNVNGGY